MFYAFIGISISLLIIASGISISIIDIDKYDYGLYFALLGIVGLISGVAVCVAQPDTCSKGPVWYQKLSKAIGGPCRTFCKLFTPCCYSLEEDNDNDLSDDDLVTYCGPGSGRFSIGSRSSFRYNYASVGVDIRMPSYV